MRKALNILSNSLLLTLQELRSNKLRTFLSLIGIAFGIFCIIGVLATVNSLEKNVQNQITSLGSNAIYIDKWAYAGGPDYPWWKYEKRPDAQYRELAYIKNRSKLAEDVAFVISKNIDIVHGDDALQSVNLQGATQEMQRITPRKIEYGRFLSPSDYENGTPVIVMGFENAENLFGNPQMAVGKTVKIKNKLVAVIGVLEKSGINLIGENPDMSLYTSYQFARQILNEKESSPILVVKARDDVSTDALSDELEGIMRSSRKLSPTEEDNFTLNQISAISNKTDNIFRSINLGGWAIGLLSLVVGAFGISNIMFVTVKERTSIIGIKKALGARKKSILTEFLLEAAIISIMGGIMGLILVFMLTLILTNLLNFPVFISAGILGLAVFICVAVGIISGFIPARSAANLDPVIAIRS